MSEGAFGPSSSSSSLKRKRSTVEDYIGSANRSARAQRMDETIATDDGLAALYPSLLVAMNS